MQTQHSWRDLLASLFQDPREKQRLVNELGVSPITVMRWINKESLPRIENVQRLLKALPAHRQELTELLAEDFPALAVTSTQGLPEDTSTQLPEEFYARILNTYVIAPKGQRFWSISDLIMELALGHLDPNHLGMAITIAQCMSPTSAGKVHSLRHRAGKGIPPWSSYLEHEPPFLGMESLAGYAVSAGRLIAVHYRTEQAWVPAQWTEWEESAVACPILASEQIAGCLIVSSTQPGYFLPFRQTLIQKYAELLTLAFLPQEFCNLQGIELQHMPSVEVQKQHFSHFRQRVSDTMLQALTDRHPISLLEAEQTVWQKLEEELLAFSVSHPD